MKKLFKSPVGKKALMIGAAAGVVLGVAFLPESVKGQIIGLVAKLKGGSKV